ncbi:MAG: hypothetical protein A3F78_02650 [Burkholderiales bacterium RIFCSPLOWO2_12_FULL_61_40]|nr:MAG: hypothetical protein A3F78_02650 [Burkholderiales bacterium RIFCSPLOWO2_12_FULL_61_40]
MTFSANIVRFNRNLMLLFPRQNSSARHTSMTTRGNRSPFQFLLVYQHGYVRATVAQQFCGLGGAHQSIRCSWFAGIFQTELLAFNLHKMPNQQHSGAAAFRGLSVQYFMQGLGHLRRHWAGG